MTAPGKRERHSIDVVSPARPLAASQLLRKNFLQLCSEGQRHGLQLNLASEYCQSIDGIEMKIAIVGA